MLVAGRPGRLTPVVGLLVESRCPALSPLIVLPRSSASTSFVLAALRALHGDSFHAVQVRLGIEATVGCSGSDQVRHGGQGRHPRRASPGCQALRLSAGKPDRCWSPAVGDG
ncbi:MAG: hypothetical protein ACRDUW_16325 [Pseudonocardiaceae bacterium]